jgi:hypothetical protein
MAEGSGSAAGEPATTATDTATEPRSPADLELAIEAKRGAARRHHRRAQPARPAAGDRAPRARRPGREGARRRCDADGQVRTERLGAVAGAAFVVVVALVWVRVRRPVARGGRDARASGRPASGVRAGAR